MKTLAILTAVSLACAALPLLAGDTGAAAGQAPAWNADIGEIRQIASRIPGARALRINVIKVAESRRPKNFAVKGAAPEPSVQARTAYQVVYQDGYVMIDSGMDMQVHRFFGRGTEEPYFADAERQLHGALRGATAIVLTHEHADHVAGVIHNPDADELAGKTLLTRPQVESLLNNPQVPEIRLTPEMAKRFIVFDYERYMPFAPGFALIKAGGHTPGSQMLYVVLQSGREYLFAGDVAWHMDGVRLARGKDAPWIKEDGAAVMAELQWLNTLARTERNLNIVISHDEDQRLQYIRSSVLGDGLELPAAK